MSLKNIKTQLTLSEPWLSFKRVRFYSILLFIIYLFAFGRLIYDSDFARPGGNTIFLDFRTAWASASLAKNGEASSAYNPAVINQYVWGSMPPYLNKTRVVTPDPNAGQREVFWLYPPTFFFSILPIGMLSFFVAYFIYMLLTAFSFFSLLKFILY